MQYHETSWSLFPRKLSADRTTRLLNTTDRTELWTIPLIDKSPPFPRCQINTVANWSWKFCTSVFPFWYSVGKLNHHALVKITTLHGQDYCKVLGFKCIGTKKCVAKVGTSSVIRISIPTSKLYPKVKITPSEILTVEKKYFSQSSFNIQFVFTRYSA